MKNDLIKKVLPTPLHPFAMKARWSVKFLIAAALWRIHYRSKAFRFWRRDQWERLRPRRVDALGLKQHAQPLVSIIIPVHNQYRFTARCLDSIAKARVLASFEILVVDDQSSDQTARQLGEVENLRLLSNEGERGFVHACNLGAAHARGRFILFLNNDTLVEDEWLDDLVTTFDHFPDAGAVGVRLVFADGRLQEAGGIVWRDASAWNYGRFLKPEAPRFSYARRVDYCSGSCLMVATDLFRELDGFDEAFAPGYYEDTDLCFRIREAGRAVVYQPAVTVCHYEGATAGRKLTEGMKRFQDEHRDVFYRRWRQTLAEHRESGVDVELEKERDVGRKLLLIEPRMIRPDRDSGSLRMFNLIRVLQRLGYRITFAPDNLLRVEPYTQELQSMGVEVLYAPFEPSIDFHLQEKGWQYDVVLLSRLEVGRRHSSRVRSLCSRAVFIYDTVDLHHVREQRRADLEESARAQKVARETRADEMDVIRQSDLTLVVSETERETLLEHDPNLEVFVVSNIHEQFESSRSFEEREGLLFIGGFEHPPNVDGVLWFAREVLPVLEAKGYDDQVHIVGSHPPPEIQALASDRLLVTGFVPDVSDYFNDCRLSIAPLRYGAGVKGKINQSMARGLPVVGTLPAIEGMGLTDGEDVLVADEPDSFAEAVLNVYQDQDLWQKLVAGGRKNIETYYSVSAAEHSVASVLNHVDSLLSPSRVWNVDQVAALLKIPASSVMAMVEREEIPYLDLDGEIRFHRPSLDVWLESRVVKGLVSAERDREARRQTA